MLGDGDAHFSKYALQVILTDFVGGAERVEVHVVQRVGTGRSVNPVQCMLCGGVYEAVYMEEETTWASIESETGCYCAIDGD